MLLEEEKENNEFKREELICANCTDIPIESCKLVYINYHKKYKFRTKFKFINSTEKILLNLNANFAVILHNGSVGEQLIFVSLVIGNDYI